MRYQLPTEIGWLTRLYPSTIINQWVPGLAANRDFTTSRWPCSAATASGVTCVTNSKMRFTCAKLVVVWFEQIKKISIIQWFIMIHMSRSFIWDMLNCQIINDSYVIIPMTWPFNMSQSPPHATVEVGKFHASADATELFSSGCGHEAQWLVSV